MIPEDVHGFIVEACVRAGLPTHDVVVNEGAFVVQAKTVIIPFATQMQESDVSYSSYKHLILKHVIISTIKFRDNVTRERTRTSFACECAFYRKDAQRRRDEAKSSSSSSSSSGKKEGGGASSTATTRWPIPFAYLVEGDETSDVFTLIIDDARGPGGCVGVIAVAASTVEGSSDTQPAPPPLPKQMGMNPCEAEAAIQWLATFHAAWWRDLPDAPQVPSQLWDRGGYWTLEKRERDVEGMSAEWDKLLAAFPNDPTLQANRGLGDRLKGAAQAVHRAARRTESERGGCATLVHGDFKMANIIIPPPTPPPLASEPEGLPSASARDPAPPAAPAVSLALAPPVVIDWQWVGPGAAAHDVMFFLYTSLSFEAVEDEDRLVRLYHERLTGELRARGSAGMAAAEGYTLERLSRDVAVHAADYVRFTIGEIWGKITPASIKAHANCANLGIHRRSLEHLTRLVRKAAAGLEAVLLLEQQGGDDCHSSSSTSNGAPPPNVTISSTTTSSSSTERAT